MWTEKELWYSHWRVLEEVGLEGQLDQVVDEQNHKNGRKPPRKVDFQNIGNAQGEWELKRCYPGEVALNADILN